MKKSLIINKWDIYFVSLSDNSNKKNKLENNSIYNINNNINNDINNDDYNFLEGDTLGHEQNMNFRPVIVISNTKYNTESKTPICLCCSSRSKYYYSSKLIENTNIDFKTYVNISQIRTLSIDRFFKKNFCINISNNKNIINDILKKFYYLIYDEDNFNNNILTYNEDNKCDKYIENSINTNDYIKNQTYTNTDTNTDTNINTNTYTNSINNNKSNPIKWNSKYIINAIKSK